MQNRQNLGSKCVEDSEGDLSKSGFEVAESIRKGLVQHNVQHQTQLLNSEDQNYCVTRLALDLCVVITPRANSPKTGNSEPLCSGTDIGV